MNCELRTVFTEAEKHIILEGLRDEFGDREFSDELVLLELEDMSRKGCLLEHKFSDSCLGCSAFEKGECPMIDWEKRHPEYRDDELARRLKTLRAELNEIQKSEIAKHLAEDRKKNGVRLRWSFVTDEQIAKAEQVLIDNGIKEADVKTVLQAIGHTLLDTELFN